MAKGASSCQSLLRSRAVEVYILALTSVGAATSLRSLAQQVFGETAPYPLYILPIMAAASYGGLAPGLFATITSALVIMSLFVTSETSSVREGTYLFLFLLDGLLISWLGEQMQLALHAADHADRQRKMIQQREKRILDSISDAFGSIDQHWRFIHANEQMADLILQSLPEILGKEIWGLLPELAAADTRTELERALREQTPVRMDLYISR